MLNLPMDRRDKLPCPRPGFWIRRPSPAVRVPPRLLIRSNMSPETWAYQFETHHTPEPRNSMRLLGTPLPYGRAPREECSPPRLVAWTEMPAIVNYLPQQIDCLVTQAVGQGGSALPSGGSFSRHKPRGRLVSLSHPQRRALSCTRADNGDAEAGPCDSCLQGLTCGPTSVRCR